jgi:hypothetical protein
MQPDTATASQAGLSLSAATAANAYGMARIAPSIGVPPLGSPVFVASPSAVGAASMSLLSIQQQPLGLTGQGLRAGDSTAATPTDQAVAPELQPPPTDTQTPGNGSAPANPVPGADQRPPSRPEPLGGLLPARDAVFVDGLWEPAAPLEHAQAAVSATSDNDTCDQAARWVFALAVGSTWGITKQQDAVHRRRKPWIGS